MNVFKQYINKIKGETMKALSLRMEQELFNTLEAIAKAEKRSINNQILLMVEKQLKIDEKEGKGND